MIKVKDLAGGYAIEYDGESFLHTFTLKLDGAEVKTGKTQAELEEYLGRIAKADNKFKTPIKAFQFNYDRKTITGVITSANIPDESFWFVGDEKEWRQRRKARLGDRYYELTEENLFKINQIKEREAIVKKTITEINDIVNTFEKQITKEYITTKQSEK